MPPSWNDQPQLVIYRLPIVTICIIILNIFIFGLISYLASISPLPQTQTQILSCLADNYPECLVVDFSNPAASVVSCSSNDARLCLKKVTTDCLKNDKVLTRCFPFDERIATEFGLVPATTNVLKFIPSSLVVMFLHGSWDHVLGNMIFLLIVGSFIEIRLGQKRFLWIYFIAGILGNLLFYLFNMNLAVPLVGASGAISGLMGANMIVDFDSAKHTEVAYVGGIQFMGFGQNFLFRFIVLQVMFSWLEASSFPGSAEVGVAYIAHVGGFLAGAACALFFTLKDDITHHKHIAAAS